MTTAENLNRIIQAKADIKAAIENKGVSVGDIMIDGYAEKINEITGGGKWVAPDRMTFTEATEMTHFDGTLVDVSNMTSMNRLFYRCSKLTTIEGISNWNVSKVTDMDGMFENCTSLTSIDLSNWNTSKVNDMTSMFYNCMSLTSVNLSGMEISNNEGFSYMFGNCMKLTSVDLRGLNTSKIKYMYRMFYGCRKLTEVWMDGSLGDITSDSVDEMFIGVGNNGGTFYYNPAYDYSLIIAQLPSTWTAVPI